MQLLSLELLSEYSQVGFDEIESMWLIDIIFGVVGMWLEDIFSKDIFFFLEQANFHKL